jgi:hypothetical protein
MPLGFRPGRNVREDDNAGSALRHGRELFLQMLRTFLAKFAQPTVRLLVLSSVIRFLSLSAMPAASA